VIRLSGYIEAEKISIARRYLIPKSLSRAGLKKSDVKYYKSALSEIANGYAREAGLRNFEKALDKIHRKIATKMLTDGVETPVTLTKENLQEFLGQPTFREDGARKITRAGMATGLAWTPFGGDTLIIEAVANPGREGFKLTGQMGDVMQESAGIAYTYVRHIAGDYGVPKEFFEQKRIHLHIPAGATPKDGPSAGITMATTLLSLATDKKVNSKVAMTGELSLVGRVLPIGGLKEKVIAARRQKIKTIIIPKENERDLDEIPEHIKKGITFRPVETMEEVIEVALS
jgi:ATP-dependent Lon protease